MNKNIFTIVLIIFLWSFGQSQASEVTIMVTGMGIDKYTIKKKADGTEIGTYATGTFAKVEIGEGTDIEVSLNNLSKTKDNLNQDWTIESGYILVSGKGFDNYSVYYNDDKLTETKTNVYKEFFSDLSYTVKLNKGEYFEPVKPPARLYAGSVVIKGQGIDRYSIFSQETELAGKETGEELEFFSGTYTVKLNNTIETVPIQANLRTEIDAGGILVSGAGNSFYSLVNGDEEIGQKKTGEIIEVFKGTYSVKLNKDIKENIIVNSGDINKSLNSHALIFKGTGGYPFYVFNSSSSDFDTENALASSTSDKALDLFTGEYKVRLNNINKDINLTDSQELTITPGRLLVTGTGEEKYNILDAQGNQLATGVAGEEIDLFQGTYSVILQTIIN
ncbi:Uncharacterized protein dnl_21810 [Desulfonema limicola]|uniref:Uncharacterized protein n=1 Tax=Desulfonema limicola TaxID=45656 RepID=A0A975B6X4_9BACT|nr:hypothetical protein [Desulfonema limicola]QTA79899.1 Uncharacterized protein dnl_21810 [Desulfonema limicola]